MSYQRYIDMQKRAYEQERPSEDIVGFYRWNERYPYETLMLYRDGDIREPIFKETRDKLALDFACGPGRMIPRMSKFFSRVDGVDISSRLIDEARQANPDSNFWVTTGDDLGGAPDNTYHFIYSTIAMQHIAVHSLRMKLLEAMKRALRPDGCITLQFAFNWRFPYSKSVKEIRVGGYNVVFYAEESTHARWDEDRVDAPGTNSQCDVGIGRDDLVDVQRDFESLFSQVQFWFFDDSHCHRHFHQLGVGGYWPTHSLFIHGRKSAT